MFDKDSTHHGLALDSSEGGQGKNHHVFHPMLALQRAALSRSRFSACQIQGEGQQEYATLAADQTRRP